MKILPFLWIMLLVGCAQAPISDSTIPDNDTQYCEKIANSVSMQRTAERALVGAAKGAVIGVGVGSVVDGATIKFAGFSGTLGVSTLVPALIVWGIIDGGSQGLFERQDRKTQIVRDCLRDKGYKVY